MNPDEIISKVKNLYPEAIIDISGEDCSFEIYVITEAFEGLNTLKRQQSILNLFSEELASGKLHALGVKARTPGEQGQQGGLVQIKL